jgi:uncharacterized protein (TIGR03435 family)
MLILRRGLLLLTCWLSFGQTADKSLTFDVASVKPAAPPVPDGRGRILMAGPSGGPGTKDPGRIHYPFMNLRNLLMTAYDVKNFQIVGPPWLDSERFEISATMPPETTKEQFRIMLQNLLAERFKMKVHRETKELPMYALVVAKGGPKMAESKETPPPAEDGNPSAPPPAMPKMGPDGFPDMTNFLGGRAGLFNIMMPGRARMIAHQQTMQDLATRLSNQLSKPVTDTTGLTGKYDFTLTFLPDYSVGPMGPLPPPPPPAAGGGEAGRGPVPAPPTDAEAPPDIFAAIQAQLGLKLESKKGPVEQIVIDHIEKTPTEN